MKIGEDGFPEVGNSKALGVRVAGEPAPPGQQPDVVTESDGTVDPVRRQGMSVVPEWWELKPYLIPKRLTGRRPRNLQARIDEWEPTGSNKLACYRLDEEPFEDHDINADLALLVDIPTHGVILPTHRVSLVAYRAALAATRTKWIIDET